MRFLFRSFRALTVSALLAGGVIAIHGHPLVASTEHTITTASAQQEVQANTRISNQRFTTSLKGLRGSEKDYRFISSIKGKPARWNPCTAITYRINPGGMSPKDVAEVKESFRRIGLASGLTFRYLGPTSYVWSKNAPNGAAPKDAAMTFAFAQSGKRKGSSDLLSTSRVVGVGGPVWRDNGISQRIVAGHVVINSEVITVLARGTGKGVRMNAYIHEIGHAVGLDHVQSTSQLMHPTLQLNLPPVLGAGDVAGLRQLGRLSGCLTNP